MQFAVYKQNDGSRHIYLLAVDWYNDPNKTRHAKFLFGTKKYAIDIKFGEMLKIVINDNIAAWTNDDTADVLEICDDFVKLQGIGSTKLCMVKNGNLLEKNIDFSDNAIKIINL